MPSPLISAAELHQSLGGVTVLDVRYRTGGPAGRAEYEKGHVPGAVYVDLDTELAAPPGEGGRHPLPPTEDFETAMRRAGVRGDRPVVVYDDWSGLAAGRAWWLLRYHGHPDVRLLDGAWPAWVEAGGAVHTGTTLPGRGDFTARPGQLPVVEADAVLGVPVLVDARAPERYRGEVEPIDPVAGHIPGAVNVPTTTNLRADGRFRSAAELRALYAAAGVAGDEQVAVYCGSGVTAVHDIVALEVAGIPAALYPGSWSGWITDPDRPVSTTTSGRP
jgi:thiosulfate/3-mercaptopyruvate sulfurtransferase